MKRVLLNQRTQWAPGAWSLREILRIVAKSILNCPITGARREPGHLYTTSYVEGHSWQLLNSCYFCLPHGQSGPLYFWGSNPSGLEMQVVVMFKGAGDCLHPWSWGSVLSHLLKFSASSSTLAPLLLILEPLSTRPGSGEAACTSLVLSQLFLVSLVNVLVVSVLSTHREFFY